MSTVVESIHKKPKSGPRSERITKYLRPGPQYSPGVRIGNWVQDMIECPKGGTLYFPPKEEIDYEKMKVESRSTDFRRNRLASYQGIGMSTVIQHDSHVKCGNYTTTNDLVYNHFPKPLCGPIQRHYKRGKHQWYPQPDLTECYGHNLTKFGLREAKRLEWKLSDVSDYNTTQYEDEYVAPSVDQYTKPADRKARNSSFTKSFRYKMTKPLTKPKNK